MTCKPIGQARCWKMRRFVGLNFWWNRRWGTSGLWYTTDLRKTMCFCTMMLQSLALSHDLIQYWWLVKCCLMWLIRSIELRDVELKRIPCLTLVSVLKVLTRSWWVKFQLNLQNAMFQRQLTTALSSSVLSYVIIIIILMHLQKVSSIYTHHMLIHLMLFDNIYLRNLQQDPVNGPLNLSI